MGDPPARTLQCSFCSKPFGRSEHLKRHERIHTADKQHQCAECQKTFGRRDALQRHQLIHQTDTPSLLLKGARACTQCATAKVRCSGEPLCSRCHQRNLYCHYPGSNGTSNVSDTDRSPQYEVLSVNAIPQQAVPAQQMTSSGAIGQVPLPNPAAMWAFDSSPLDTDFFDPNILSTANWLDAVVDSGFADLSWDISVAQGGQYEPYSNLDQQGYFAPRTNHRAPADSLESTHEHHSSAGLVSTVSAQSGTTAGSAAEACASAETTPTRSGEYYVDGQAARLPRTKRRKLSSGAPLRLMQTTSGRNFTFRCPLSGSTDLAHRIAIPTGTYSMFQGAFRAISAGPWAPFDGADFLPQEVFEHLISLYFSCFHKTLPFVHPSTFDAANVHWLLLLALAAIGAHYLGDESDMLAVSLHEMLRRCLTLSRENTAWLPPTGIVLAQVEMLLLIGLLFSGDERHTERGLEMHGLLGLCHDAARHEYDQTVQTEPSLSRSRSHTEDKWRSWIRLESAKRTAYSAWLLSTMIRYQLQLRRSLSLADASLPLPGHDALWTLSNAEEWDKAMPGYAAPPALQDALQELYVDKRLPKERGEFARILLIHGLYQRAWEVERYFGSPLSSWSPTATKERSKELLPNAPVWLPSIPTYNKWQNSSCDCLDILHWQANATIGQASGLEHPTVGHLHLARVVLLSPINHIVQLARVMTTGAHETQLQDRDRSRQICRRWAMQGVYKARLAAIHAGVTLWHIRRYSVDGFYEAPAVALATLMLWAFGTFSSRQRPKSRASNFATDGQTGGQTQADENASEEDTSDDASCGIILLDRPTDDELVQQFIRKGSTMCAHITNVGDLYGPRGPELVLAEGIKLLSSLKCWGVASHWVTLLERLLHVCQEGKAPG